MSPQPTHIGRYEIKSLIGRGGMGHLYLAHDPNTHRLVALKLLSAALDSSEFRQRFVREARALAALNHPNIVSIYDTGEFDGAPFIVMEYVRGETIAEMIARCAPIPVSQKLKLMMELCAGLAQAHDAGIIHRDIKPANLIVDQQRRLKILDFGIARVAEGSKTRVGLPLTQVNIAIGTPGYMSPEQVEGGAVDHRSDIFAVGAVCYELLASRVAFSGANTRQIERGVLLGKPTPLATQVPGLDPEIDEIILRALKRDPNKRYQDAATFERALGRLRARLPAEDAESLVRPTPPPPQVAGGQSPEARADAAYHRARAAFEGGALSAARRFAAEAVAEDPSHKEAGALVERLKGGTPPTQVSSAVPLAPTVVSTAVEGGSASTLASAPTIIVSPSAARSPSPEKQTKPYRSPSAKAPIARSYQRLRGLFVPAAATMHEPFWKQYRWLILAAAALLVVATTVGIMASVGWLRVTGQSLSVTRPVGGTLTGAGIVCGTGGSDCTVTKPTGETIELRPVPDAGFAFQNYTGDCAPGGRTIMTGPRTCGAMFGSIEGAGPQTYAFAIAPVPEGGMVEAVGIRCGTQAVDCSEEYPENVPVELIPKPDPGYMFMAYLGDCATTGKTQMSGPRTCGAQFSRTVVSTSTVPPPGPLRPRPSEKAPTTDPPVSTPGPGDVVRETSVVNHPVVVSPQRPPPDRTVEAPISADEYAKQKIKELLADWCRAYDTIDPTAVQRVFPNENMEALTMQLNSTKYRSVQCTVGEPTFQSLDAAKGTAKVQVDVKRVYEHTILTKKKDTSELVATLSVLRPAQRSPWLISAVTYKPK